MAAVAVVDDRDRLQWWWWWWYSVAAAAFDGMMASAMDYDERTRGRRKERQLNNQPAR